MIKKGSDRILKINNDLNNAHGSSLPYRKISSSGSGTEDVHGRLGQAVENIGQLVGIEIRHYGLLRIALEIAELVLGRDPGHEEQRREAAALAQQDVGVEAKAIFSEFINIYYNTAGLTRQFSESIYIE